MTKTITLPVETYKKMEDYFSFCKDYTEEMNDYLTDFETYNETKNLMISNVLDWCFDEWFYENWENKRYEGWEEPVPTTEEMDRFINFLEETYTLCPTWKYIKSTNQLKFSVSRNIGGALCPEYEPVKVTASCHKREEN